MILEDRSETIRAWGVLIVVWLPAILVSALVTVAAILAFLSEPMWSALAFLLALPTVLFGMKSLKASAIAMVVLFLWDVVLSTWPHISFEGFFGSIIDVLLLVAAVLSVVAAVVFPFESVIEFFGYLRFRRGY
jgi:hypothetical protein